MLLEAFSEEWVKKLYELLNESQDYKKAAAKWEGGMVLVDAKEPAIGLMEDKAVYLDLWHGECREAKVATEEDFEKARFVLKADPFTWLDILEGKLETISAVMRGKLKLAKGSAIALTPHVRAAKELVNTVRKIESTYDGGFLLVSDPALAMNPGRAVYGEVHLDNEQASLKEARKASAQDIEASEFASVATPKTWAQIAQGKLDVITALKKGELKLVKGSVLALVAFVKPLNQVVGQALEMASQNPELKSLLLEA